MRYLTNQEITKLYSVSYDAVRGWIQSAKQGKNDLLISEVKDGVWRIAETDKNKAIITALVAKGKKHKNSKALKVITPQPLFYELYNEAQQFDLISNITNNQEIPLQYSYFGEGANYWDRYCQRLFREQTPSCLKGTIDLLSSNLLNLDHLIGNNAQVNIIDLGVGNGLPVMDLIEHLLERKILCRYIGIDISPYLLAITKQALLDKFGDKIIIETHLRDLTIEGFRDIVVNDYLDHIEDRKSNKVSNLVLFLGGTITNFRSPEDTLRSINKSLLPSDLLVMSDKLDTPNSRRYFDFNVDTETAILSDMDRWIVDLLGIEHTLYDVEQFYDNKKRSRFIRIRMNIAISMKFNLRGITHQVDINKNDALLLLRAKHYTARETIELLAHNGFDLLNAGITRDQEYLLTISNVAVDS